MDSRLKFLTTKLLGGKSWKKIKFDDELLDLTRKVQSMKEKLIIWTF